MLHSIKTFFLRRLPHGSVGYAYLRAAFSRHPLPPGPLVPLNLLERKDRGFLLAQAAQVGPVFKALAWDQFWVCVVGLPLGRRLLRDHGADLKPMTIQLDSLFPKGFLRQLQGEDHRNYRRALVRAIRPDDFAASRNQLEEISARGLADYAARQNENTDSPEAYIAALNAMASGMLVRIFFGAAAGSAAFERIMAGYRKLGPFGLVWNIGEEQKSAFVEIRDYLRELSAAEPEQRPSGWPQSILGRMTDDVTPDATMLGNVIYMVEMGRYDTYSLFRWLTKFAAENPALLERIAGEPAESKTGHKSFAEAFVLETLRLEQSERLMRKAQRDFVFEGFLIPKHATIRVCVWESHKSAERFPDPFRFDPERFLTGTPSNDEFAPFGLDQHQCPFSDIAIQTSVIFLRQLARRYTVATIADGLPVRGAYHWEPASQFGVRLERRTGL